MKTNGFGYAFMGRCLIKAACLLMLAFTWVWAHGGGEPQLTNAVAGPYRVSVWTQPEPMRVGRGHFSVAVSKPAVSSAAQNEAGAPVLDATIKLHVTSLVGDRRMPVAIASRENAVNKLFYEADIELPTAGSWQVTIAVEGAHASGETFFQVEVLPPSSVNWMVWVGLMPIVMAAVGLSLWFCRQSR